MTNFLTLLLCAGLVLYEASDSFREFVQRWLSKAVPRG